MSGEDVEDFSVLSYPSDSADITKSCTENRSFLLPGEPVFTHDEFFFIQSQFSGMCIQIDPSNNNTISMYTPNFLEHQKWFYESERYLKNISQNLL